MIENDVKQQLITAGIDIDANIVLGALPTTPDNVIVVTTASSVLTSSLNTLTNQALIPPGISDIQQTITIAVRNTSYSTGQDKIWKTYNALVGQQSGFILCNSRQMFIIAVEPPHYSTTDASNRNVFVFNFVVNTSRDN